jgi:regulator of sirC expression with transglutaminase-like and TPR domain
VSFDELARNKDAEVDVLLGALLVARDVYPDLDVARVMRSVDELAAPLFPLGLEALLPEEQARLLGEFLYETQGFHGNEDDYYDPKNSLLSDVLTSRQGIPLTLAIVYCEVARRVGVQARGVGFPGHFLVRIERGARGAGEPPLLIDPFFRGRILTTHELEMRLARVLGKEAPKDLSPYLVASTPRATLVRLLTNLKAIYLTRGERARAHLALDRIVSLLPTAVEPLMERGKLAALLGAKESARDDLTRALTLKPARHEELKIKSELAALGSKSQAN